MIFFSGLNAVSYTHLDVYKRQVEIDTLLAKYNFCIDLNEAMVKKSENVRMTLKDVYKRQGNETYIDRNQSGKIGVYQTTPERMFHYYVAPQSLSLIHI